ncbi:hypothetical protein DRN43_00015 [Thermococci archaeon]|nr:MAG: hypothetical protein DRN43_00015 [Thermococci archaeon]
MSLGELLSYIESVEHGETILMEHSSTDPIHMIFKSLLSMVKPCNPSILIVEVLDTLFLIKKNLEAFGENTEFLDSLDVIKAGGAIEIGNVIKKFEVYEDPHVYMTSFLKALREYYEKNDFTITFLLGVEKLVNLDQVDASIFPLYLGNVIESFLGHGNRIAVYFVNRELALSSFLAHMEEASTRVVEIKHEKGVMIAKIKKSPKPEEYGKEFRVHLEELASLKV